MKLNTQWTKHLKDPEEIESFKSYVSSSQGVLEVLSNLIESKMDVREVFKEEDYNNPSWAYKQADRNGYLRALKEINQLLKGNDQ